MSKKKPPTSSRGLHVRVKTADKRSVSSTRWLQRQLNDPYVQKARAAGYRSRAAFKLEEMDEKFHLLKPGMRVVDLGCAPGGWSQFARPLLGDKGRLIALDILPMDPVAEVDFICGDFREAEVLGQLEDLVGPQAIDLVLSDMAPNLSGIDVSDQVSSIYLCELALDFAKAHLKPKGMFLTKIFQGEGFDAYLKELRQTFETVTVRKPKASRPRSREVYLLARNFRAV